MPYNHNGNTSNDYQKGYQGMVIYGNTTYTDTSTGATLDRNFYKIFLKNFLKAMGAINSRKAQVAYWIIENLNSQNELKYTYRQIAAMTGISYQTVARTIRTLLDMDFLRKSGKYLMVNPDIIFKGKNTQREHALKRYEDADTDSKQLRYEALERTILALRLEKDKLEQELLREKAQKELRAKEAAAINAAEES